MSNITLPVDVLQGVMQYMEKTSALLAEVAAEKQATSTVIPGVVDTLVARGLLPELKKESAQEALHDPTKALASLQKIAESASPPSMGGPSKQASTQAIGTPKMKESDRVFLEGLDLI